jgi:hypothetical protein
MSETARRVAGTYVPDELGSLTNTLTWVTNECRTGSLAECVRKFCSEQLEPLDASLVICEGVTSDAIQCRITCRCYDHESTGTFPLDVQFKVNPTTGDVTRLG